MFESSDTLRAPADRPRLDGGYYERLFRSAGFAIVVCAPDGAILERNVAAGRLFCAGGELDGKHVTGVFPDSERDAVRAHLDESVRTGAVVEFQARLGGTDAEPVVYAVILTPVRSDDGETESVALWFRDITPRVRLARALGKSERLSTLGRMSGAVAHHYNNLVGSIQTSLDYAMNMQTVSVMRRALARTSEAVSRAGAITRQLLAFAQADHRSEDVSDLGELFRLFFDEQKPLLAQRKIELVCDAQPLPACSVRREALRIVLSNLVENAIEAMPAGGTLTATLARRDESSVTITLSDTGGGIPNQHMEHLFEPFFTTKGELARGGGRNPGLGLAVAHGLVRGMGGDITAANVPGSGARFDIVMPLNRNTD